MKILNLNDNKITNLNFLDNIKYKSLEELSLKNNLINNGIESIKNLCDRLGDVTLESLKVKIKDDIHQINFSYSKNDTFHLYFDYLYDIDKNLDILQNIDLSNIFSLDLSSIKLTKMDFLHNQTFRGVSLNLDNNLIDNISILTNAKMNHYIHDISLRQNPIRKGLHVLKDDYFRCVYLELDIVKTENEYKIYANYKYPNIDLEFYISDINDIKNIIDFDNTFIKFLKSEDNMKFLESELLQNKSYEKKQLYETIKLLLSFLKKENKINIIQENNEKEIIRKNNLIFSENNKNLLEKLFIYLKERNQFNSFLSQLTLCDLDSDFEKLIQNLIFLYAYELKLLKCNFDLNILRSLYNCHLIKIDLSETYVTDIKELCDNANLYNLETLNLSNNPNIFNLYELKNAKFTNLKQLYLSNNNLFNLIDINMGEYPFEKLTELDLSKNQLNSIGQAIKAFKELKFLNLEYNNLNKSAQMEYLYENYPKCEILLKGNNI